MLARFELGAVERQIAWLPSRSAKNPARFLAAAIEGGYDRPLNYDRPLKLRGPAGEVESSADRSAGGMQVALGRDASTDIALSEDRLADNEAGL